MILTEVIPINSSMYIHHVSYNPAIICSLGFLHLIWIFVVVVAFKCVKMSGVQKLMRDNITSNGINAQMILITFFALW